MTIQKIRWEIISNSDLDNNSIRLGYVNDKLLFQIQVTGSKVYNYKLFSYPLKDTIFVAGNNTKLLIHKKSETGFKAPYVLLLMNDAEALLEDFIQSFFKKPDWYKVKLNEEHNAKPDQIFKGYLKSWTGEDEPALYTKYEASNKARMFNGKIEKA